MKSDFYLLGIPCKILGIIISTNTRSFKQNIKYKEIDNKAQDFYVENPHTKYGDNKP